MTTMMWPMRRAATVAAERIATTCGTTSLTYAETATRCRHLAAGLRSLGLGPGDRVAVLGPNCHRYVELYQTVPGAGMVLVPLNQRHTDGELRYALDDAGATVLFAGRPVADLPPCVRHVIDLDDAYEALLAVGADQAGRGRVAAGRRRRRARRPLLHRRHDRGVEGRDAVARQPRRQRLPPPGGVPLRGRDPLADRRPAVPRRRVDRRAGDGVARRPSRRAADVRSRRRRRPHRLGAGHGHAARAHDAGGDERRAARPTARRLDAAADRPRRLADRHRDVAPGARGLPGRRADAHLRRHRDVADGDLPARTRSCSSTRRWPVRAVRPAPASTSPSSTPMERRALSAPWARSPCAAAT